MNLLPLGLDDLEYGINLLLSADYPLRANIAQMIVDDLSEITGTASSELIMAVTAFSSWGVNPDHVRQAFCKFAVEVGPWIGHKKTQANFDANKKTKLYKASRQGSQRRIEESIKNQEYANKWFDKAFKAYPGIGHKLLLDKSIQIIKEQIKAAENDFSRYVQANNEYSKNLLTTQIRGLRREELLLTRSRAKAYLNNLNTSVRTT